MSEHEQTSSNDGQMLQTYNPNEYDPFHHQHPGAPDHPKDNENTLHINQQAFAPFFHPAQASAADPPTTTTAQNHPYKNSFSQGKASHGIAGSASSFGGNGNHYETFSNGGLPAITGIGFGN